MTHFRHALRQVRRSPGFTLVAVLTLALGIGACTAMFSLVRVVLLKPLPFREPGQLVWIENVFGGGLSGRTSRVDTFNGWREQNQSFEMLAAYFAFSDYGRHTLTGAGEPERLRGAGVSDNLLQTLGVRLLHGRNFTAEECRWQGPGAVILSHAYWRRRFGGDPAVVGRTFTINNAPTTVVGVLPPEFDFDSVFTPGNEVELLMPFPLTPETANWGNTVFGIGRLKPGITVAQAQAELTVISQRLRAQLPHAGEFGAIVSPLDSALRGKFRASFVMLTGAVACVLAIACVNLSNLLLARANARRQEFAVRAALGASRRHLVAQALAESLLLAFAGAAVGVPVAVWATSILAQLQTFGVPLLQEARVDFFTLLVAAGTTALAGVGCAVLPALHLATSHGHGALQAATHQRSAGRGASTTRNVLVVTEVALACTLLVGAGLLFRSFNALLQVNLGFNPQHALSWRVDPPRRFENNDEGTRYLDALAQRVSALPGVESVGLSDTLPLGRNRTWGAGALGVEYPQGRYPVAFPRIVGSHYLQALGVPLVAGRYFDERDHVAGTKSVIINESLARELWPEVDPIGRKLAQSGGSTVIGVVANVRHSSLERSGGNEMYFDYHQSADWNAMEMVVRSSRPAAALIPEVRAAIRAYDPSLPSGEYYELEQLVDHAVAPRRLITRLLGVFSTLALSLAALGLYGVLAYSVVQRTQEIGIRMAIGAQRADILRLILNSGLKLVALGIGLGLLGALAAAQLLKALLFGVTAHDPLVFAGNAALLIATATIASLVPALRATRVDPMVTLRSE